MGWVLLLAPVVYWAGHTLYRYHRYVNEIDRVLNCGLNLRLVGEALRAYVAELPAGADLPIERVVDELVLSGRLSPKTTQCAISGKAFCFRGSLADLTPPVDESLIIGYELGDFHLPNVRANVLFANGNARMLSTAEYEARLGPSATDD